MKHLAKYRVPFEALAVYLCLTIGTRFDKNFAEYIVFKVTKIGVIGVRIKKWTTAVKVVSSFEIACFGGVSFVVGASATA
jgi:hypothetical protein